MSYSNNDRMVMVPAESLSGTLQRSHANQENLWSKVRRNDRDALLLLMHLCAVSRYDGTIVDDVVAQHENYVAQHGWQLFANVLIEGPTGYYAKAYINDETKTIVIAHRGTKTSPPSEGNVRADYLIATGSVPKAILRDSFGFINAVYEKMSTEKAGRGYKIYQTGFSLGGFLAGVGGAYLERTHPECSGGVVTFDAPGTLPALQALIAIYPLLFVNNSAKTLDYVISPNSLVGVCNERMAREVRAIKIFGFEQQPQSLSSLGLEFNHHTPIENWLKIIADIHSHNLNELIAKVRLGEFEISREHTNAYTVVKSEPVQSDKPFNINTLLIENAVTMIGQNVLAPSGRWFMSLDPKVAMLVLIGGIVGGGLLINSYGANISSTLAEKLQQLQEFIAPYQDILNTMYLEFGVTGFKIGAPTTVLLPQVTQAPSRVVVSSHAALPAVESRSTHHSNSKPRGTLAAAHSRFHGSGESRVDFSAGEVNHSQNHSQSHQQP